jgi:hypothetical protein
MPTVIPPALVQVLHSIVDELTLDGNPAKQVLHDQIASLVAEVKEDVKKDVKGLLADLESNG